MATDSKTSVETSARIDRLRNPMYACMVSDLHVIESDRLWAELESMDAS
jgi:hypothetical protein